MIIIRNFFLTHGFTRRDYEFNDQGVIVKTKSPTYESEDEVEYTKIKAISTSRRLNLDWLWYGSFIIMILMLINFILRYPFRPDIGFYWIEQTIVLLGLAICIPAFIKHDYCHFVDANRNTLFTVWINNQFNRQQLNKALNLVRQATELTGDASTIQQRLANTPPVFEVVEYAPSDFLNKSVTRLFDERLVNIEKSLVEEYTFEISYFELNGKIRSIKASSSSWGSLLCYWNICFILIIGSTSTFFPWTAGSISLYVHLAFGGLWWMVAIVLYLMQYVKQNFLTFYNHNDQALYSLAKDKNNQQQIDKAVEYIQNQVSKLAPQ